MVLAFPQVIYYTALKTDNITYGASLRHAACTAMIHLVAFRQCKESRLTKQT